jgi:peptidyl-prolyl cis-trans isomerase B (cyclophilin B)
MMNEKRMFYVKLFMHALLRLGLLFCAEQVLAAAPPSTSKAPLVKMYTSQGEIDIILDENTPLTTHNFLNYVQSGFYNGTIFHRVIDGFMIQGGGFTPDMHEKTTLDPVKNEGSHCGQNKRGSVAMARTSDPDSATAQFFINVNDNDFLNFQSETLQGWGYCAFGHVVNGMEVVDKIKSVSTTTRNGFQNVPVDLVLIQSVTVEQP